MRGGVSGYFWFLSSYWFFLGLVISSPRIGQSFTHFSLKQVGLTLTVFSSMGRLRTKFFFWFYIFCNWSNLFKNFWVFAFFRCLICFFALVLFLGCFLGQTRIFGLVYSQTKNSRTTRSGRVKQINKKYIFSFFLAYS
jgi:hypothetical protein